MRKDGKEEKIWIHKSWESTSLLLYILQLQWSFLLLKFSQISFEILNNLHRWILFYWLEFPFIYFFINSNKTLQSHNYCWTDIINAFHLNDKFFEASVGDFLSFLTPANTPLLKVNSVYICWFFGRLHRKVSNPQSSVFSDLSLVLYGKHCFFDFSLVLENHFYTKL